MALPAPAAPTADGHFEADVAIVGAGLAGLYAAINLPAHLSVVIVDKAAGTRSGSSPWAQGGMAVALGPDDSPELHAVDTERAGAGLCDPMAVRVLTREAPAHTRRLLELGAAFDRLEGREGSNDPAHLHLAREGGQTAARSAHRADATGAEMVRALRAAATPRVQRLTGTAVAIAREDLGAPASGVWVQDGTGTLQLLRARAVLLATGGCGALFAATTNQAGATGDGVALAYHAGAAVRDMEFVQFHPTGLAVQGAWRFLLTEALRGAGATLHAADGHRFMVGEHPDAELAPRHVVSRAILRQPDGRAWLDATMLGEQLLEHEFPTVLHGARSHGFDLATERVPVTPAAHYMVGGVRTDLDARTSLPGLYAAGEVASTGLHGANRLAGNSLAEALVFGARAAAAITADLPDVLRAPGRPPEHVDAPPRSALGDDLPVMMWRGAGPVRNAAGLAELADDLGALRKEACLTEDIGAVLAPDPQTTQLTLALTTCELIRRAAVERLETRGGHVREDHPEPDPLLAGFHSEQIRPG
jgi:L-aspartate oxidase